MLFTDTPKAEAKNVFEKGFVCLKNRDESKERDAVSIPTFLNIKNSAF